MTKAERKKIFFNILKPYFKEKGFKPYLTSGDPCFNCLSKDKDQVIHFFFNFPTRTENIIGGGISLTLYEVENYILDIGLPHANLKEVKLREKYHLTTVSSNLRAFSSENPLHSKEEVEGYAYKFIEFYESKGVKFIDKYTYLPNILKEMDERESKGEEWYPFIASNDSLTRGLIISKLCNDKDYPNKFKMVDDFISDFNDEKETLYWEKYKKVLESIVPKYNLDVS